MQFRSSWYDWAKNKKKRSWIQNEIKQTPMWSDTSCQRKSGRIWPWKIWKPLKLELRLVFLRKGREVLGISTPLRNATKRSTQLKFCQRIIRTRLVIKVNWFLKLTKSLYSAQPDNKPARDAFLNFNVPKLLESEPVFCEVPITLDELMKALTSMGNNKSPGFDGLSTNFYKHFWPLLGEKLVIVYIIMLSNQATFRCHSGEVWYHWLLKRAIEVCWRIGDQSLSLLQTARSWPRRLPTGFLVCCHLWFILITRLWCKEEL